MTVIGKSIPRLEDRALLTGTGRFAGDQNLEGQLHMRVVRSSVAHGRIRGIDVVEARAALCDGDRLEVSGELTGVRDTREADGEAPAVAAPRR